ncbi:MAG TPA: GGDEF domain-containing protein [Beijerinckiaceae bacterium]|jgi:diguanylate cyclase
MASTTGDTERTFLIADRALELMKAYGSSASPRSYEVWYTYVSGHKPLMNDAIKRLSAERGAVSDAEIETIYEAHLSGQRYAAEAQQTSASVIAEIDDVVEMIEFALGSTAKYGQSLEALTQDLSTGPVDRTRLREVIGSLVNATKEVASTNQTLDARLKETRSEIETLRETLEAVRIESLTDPLTGVSNRKHFEETLIQAIERAGLDRSALALIVIDIDFFKRFNDTYGHLTGDQVLKLVGMTMRETVKSSRATIARFGGEEFAIILPGAAIEPARGVAESIRQSVMGRELVKRATGESLGKVTISAGVAALQAGDTAVSLLERADQCMYMAKRMGRNRTVTDQEYAGPGELPDVA